MRSQYTIPPWKAAPFVRLIIPLFAGVLMQWYLKVNVSLIGALAALTVTGYVFFSFVRLGRRYRLRWIQGLMIQAIIFFAGMFLTWNNDIRNQKNWFGHTYKSSDKLIITISEPLVKKEKSFKALGAIACHINGNTSRAAVGNILIYFRDTPTLHYGDRILTQKPLQAIKNTGNPGAFDYVRYAAFQQQFHTVFLNSEDYVLLPGNDLNSFRAFIFHSRQYILEILRTYVSTEKNIGGIAEALLIGYKHDLDKDLMQAYTNTGVVHIIAISGLHLGLIYVMLSWLMNVMPLIKRYGTMKVIIILSCLWLFSILTGSSASVLRSALMFSCILIGKTYFTQSSVYNAIAASAFMLVCYNPYFLWDVGFQLSYLAVIGIVWLQRPILNLVYLKNRWLKKLWSMVAVTLAAQLAAFPICLFYFHQFPNLFLITNLIAVPLSSIILFAEIFLMCFSWLDLIAGYAGKLIAVLIELMNKFITFCNGFSWSATENIYATILTTWSLYGIVFFVCAWCMYRNASLLKNSLVCIIAFCSLHLFADISSSSQHKIVVYNISRTQAIDFISANTYFFLGDSAFKQSGVLYDFHIKPSRIKFQARQAKDINAIYNDVTGFAVFRGKRIFIIDKAKEYDTLQTKIALDILIISHNPSLKISGLLTALKPAIIVFDASNSLWKIEEWKKECSALLLPFHSVPQQGAFVSDIN